MTIAPITGTEAVMATDITPAQPLAAPAASGRLSFADFVTDGIATANDRLIEAERLSRAFALGEDIPVHQVTFALEQARLSLELMLQVRNRLLESYQEIMRMQA